MCFSLNQRVGMFRILKDSMNLSACISLVGRDLFQKKILTDAIGGAQTKFK